MSSAILQNDRMVSTTRITREEFLQKIFQDNYEDLKTKGTLRTVRLSVPGTEVCLAHILTPTHTEVYQNLGLHIGVHEGEDHRSGSGDTLGSRCNCRRHSTKKC